MIGGATRAGHLAPPDLAHRRNRAPRNGACEQLLRHQGCHISTHGPAEVGQVAGEPDVFPEPFFPKANKKVSKKKRLPSVCSGGQRQAATHKHTL